MRFVLTAGGTMSKKYNKIVTPLYVFNMVWQALFSLAAPIGVLYLIAFLLEKYLSAPGWIYAVLIPIGAISGMSAMIGYIVRMSDLLEHLEKQNKEREKERKRSKGPDAKNGADG